MFKFALIVLALFIAVTTATNVKQCKKGQPFPLSVEVVGCEEPPCEVIKGSTGVMYVHFVGTKNNIKKLKTVAHATTLGITIPYDLPDDVADVCSNLMYNATCPIDKTEDVVYAFNLYIEPYFPEVSVSVQVSLEDEANESVACFVCNVKVRKGPNSALQLQ